MSTTLYIIITYSYIQIYQLWFLKFVKSRIMIFGNFCGFWRNFGHIDVAIWISRCRGDPEFTTKYAISRQPGPYSFRDMGISMLGRPSFWLRARLIAISGLSFICGGLQRGKPPLPDLYYIYLFIIYNNFIFTILRYIRKNFRGFKNV